MPLGRVHNCGLTIGQGQKRWTEGEGEKGEEREKKKRHEIFRLGCTMRRQLIGPEVLSPRMSGYLPGL